MKTLTKKYNSYPTIVFIMLVSLFNIGYTTSSPGNPSGMATIASHGKDAHPDYGIVFNQTQVMRIEIKVNNKNWALLQSHIDTTARPHEPMPQMPHKNNMMSPPEMHKNRPANDINRPKHPENGMPFPPGNGHKKKTPSWADCTISYMGKQWNHVGIRCKGNSSLRAAEHSMGKKFSFKLDFEQFEDNFPETKNQRFYGFKQLNLNNNYKDASLMREKVAADLFRAFGVPAAKTAFCAVYVDKGKGAEFYGIYTLVEEVDDTVIETQFTSKKGNLYKPDGRAATFAKGTFSTEQMCRKTNKKSKDYSDVELLYKTINNYCVSSENAKWNKQLESIFDVDGFLKWLAANNVMQNWDVYGQSAHNYYLYNNPNNGLLTWIPWDNNEALFSHHRNGSADLNINTNENWPLLKNILSQPAYKATYHRYLKQFIDEVFTTGTMQQTYSEYYKMLKPYVQQEMKISFSLHNANDFDNAVAYLQNHVKQRNTLVKSYLTNQ